MKQNKSIMEKYDQKIEQKIRKDGTRKIKVQADKEIDVGV